MGAPDPDIRRRAGWLPNVQDDLEAWLASHRDRVETADKPHDADAPLAHVCSPLATANGDVLR